MPTPDGKYLVTEAATPEQIEALDPMNEKIIVQPAFIEVSAEPQTLKEANKDIKIIVPLTAEEQARKQLEADVKAARESANLTTHDVRVVDDVQGNPVIEVVELSQAEKDNFAANLHEPQEATQAEIDAIDPATHAVITRRAGFADGSIRSVKQIREKSQREKEEYAKEQAQNRIKELRDKVTNGTATNAEVSQLQALIEVVKV